MKKPRNQQSLAERMLYKNLPLKIETQNSQSSDRDS